MEIPKYFNTGTSESRNFTNVNSDRNSEKGVRILSVDRVTVEKIVLETCKSRKILLTKSESSRIVSEQNNNFSQCNNPDPKNFLRLKANSKTNSRVFEKNVKAYKNSSKVPILSIRNNSIPLTSKIRIRPVRLTKTSINDSNLTFKENPRSLTCNKYKVPLKLPLKFVNEKENFISNNKCDLENLLKEETTSNKVLSVQCDRKVDLKHNKDRKSPEDIEDKNKNIEAYYRLAKCQYEIEQLQKVLGTKINVDTVQIYKERLPTFDVESVKILPIIDDYSRKKGTEKQFDKTFLNKLKLSTKLQIEENSLLKTNLDQAIEPETDRVFDTAEKQKYDEQVGQLEKKCHKDLLKDNLELNSPDSLVEQLSSISSSEYITKNNTEDEILTLKLLKELPKLEEDEFTTSDIKLEDLKSNLNKGEDYGNLILFDMEPCSSKSPKDEKKKKGIRRLLPGIFSPKESRKTPKKDVRERKRRDDKHLPQYQQNGNYSKSIDSMKLNEDIRRNVTSDPNMIDDRIHDMKQNIFPLQGIITSTPDHFLQSESNYSQTRHAPRHYDADNTSYNFVSPETEWIEQNIISGSPDMRQLKNSRQIESDRHCSLERKHSFQEPVQSCFIRNHGQSGRISAPPSGRYVLRSRIVHPMDRPLPAIPQRVQFVNENQQEIRNYPRVNQEHVLQDANYRENRSEFYDTDSIKRMEIHRNQFIDTNINQNQSTVQVHQSRQIYSDEKLSLRAPKYSPSFSQKSGDYADSSYTPNSSQKSGFSPTSSKSGEYYLNSPHASSPTSPSNSSGDKGEPDLQTSPHSESFSRSHNEEVLYDDNRKARREPKPISPRGNQEIPPPSKSSPNIPVFSSFIKAHANIETISKDESFNDKEVRELTNKKVENFEDIKGKEKSEDLGPKENYENIEVHENYFVELRKKEKNFEDYSMEKENLEVLPPNRASPPERTKRVTSPLMIIPPISPILTLNNVSPSSNSQGILKETNQQKAMSPLPYQEQVKMKVLEPIKVMNQNLVTPRKAQPCDQILIASPKRDIIYDSPKSHSIIKSELVCPDSPIPIVDSPSQALNTQSLKHIVAERACFRSPNDQQTIIETHKTPEKNKEASDDNRQDIQNISLNIPHSESSKHSIYQRSPIQRNVQTLNSSESSSAKNNERYTVATSEPLYSESRIAHNQPININSPKMQSTKEDINGENKNQAIPIYDSQQQKTLSPSKKQTMHNLETYFWQQKALDAQRKNVNSSPTVIKHQPQIHQDAPEIRDAMYWQKLKKLDEEQQRRFYEQNQKDERNDPIYWKKKLQTSPTRKVHGSAPSLFHQTCSVPVQEGIYWENKGQRASDNVVVGKPPIMGQKVQNQPVLVVRPQPVAQERSPKNVTKIVTIPTVEQEQQVNRCQSASPRFLINEDFRNVPLTKSPSTLETSDKGFSRVAKEKGNPSLVRKPQTPPIYEEEIDIDKRPPPPIFKRGSLISNSNSSIEYGTMGPKRVSFSNQANCPTIGNYGKWPTKHGMAPEPPTRRNKDNETRVPQQQQQQQQQQQLQQDAVKIYGNVGQPPSLDIYAGHPSNIPVYQKSPKVGNFRNAECEYDANKPLPPPPRDASWSLRRTASLRETSRSPNTKIESAQLKNDVTRKWSGLSESESGSEAGEVQRILHRPGGTGRTEGEGANDLGRCGGGGGFGGGTRGSSISGSGGGGRSRDEPRRHTLSGDHQPSLHHQFNTSQQIHPLHPHHLPTAHNQYGTLTGRHTMDLEMGTKSRQRKAPLPRGYPPPSTAMLFDDDPGIMSEVETSSTGFRRGGKQRSSLPVVRTPSKTLERPLGLVFLQYRSETKRALLPNEITSIDTVKALFVRSFPKQLTMEYLDSPHVKVYIHDSSKDMFYELEDLRSHLRDIRDRSVLRLFESSDGMPGPLGPAGGAGLPPHWEDQSYFSEPEFDSEFQHQHIHKSKNVKNSSSGNYYIGGSSTLPRGGSLLRAYSPAPSSVVGPNSTPTQAKTLTTPGGGVAPAKPLRSYQGGKSPLGSLGGSSRFSRDSSVSLYSIPDRIHGEGGYMSSPERGSATGPGRYPPVPYSGASSYEDPYYSQYSGTVTPVIDEEASDTELLEESYSLYGVKPSGRPPSGPLARSPFPPGAPTLPPVGPRDDVTRLRVENMERQLANLTGIVQKALIHPQHTSPSPRDYLQIPAGREPYTRTQDDSYLRTDAKPPKLGKDKSVSFEKSVSFSDEPPDMNSPKQHSPQHAADTKPTKPAIKSSTLPRMSSQERERERHKPTPPPKPVALTTGQYVYGDLTLAPEMYNQLRVLQKKAKDLNQEKRSLRRMAQSQSHTVRESIRDAYITIRAMLMSLGESAWAAGDTEKLRLSREEDLYKQEMLWLEKDLTGLESTVEELRGNVINRKTRVNMSDVENMALILNKASKTVADLKVRFPSLQEGMKGLLSSEMEKVIREEKFLKEEPDRLESVLKRCKKLTGTLVTLKRLASVQEQRLPNAGSVDVEETPPITPTSTQHSKTTAPVPAERTLVGSASVLGGGPHVADSSAPNQQRPENALDALLDELQTFSRPASQLSQASNSSHPPTLADLGRSASHIIQTSRAPNMSDIGRKGSIDSTTNLAILTPGSNNTLRRLHSYPSSSDTDTSPPIARLQVSDGGAPPQKPPVPERNAELLQIATARRVPPPPPPRTSSRSPLASPTSPQLPPRNPTTGGTLRRARNNGKPPMALPSNANANSDEQQPPANNIVSTSNSSSCESVNSQEGIQNKKGRHEQLEQRHQELLRRQKVLQEQYTRLQQFQNAPPAPSDLLKKTGSESNLLAKMGLGMSTTTSGSLTSLLATKANSEPNSNNIQNNTGNQTTTNKIYETDIL
ncbi:uncharacterized protein LOC122499218 isoform X4 [Leptopilina heterotoma]|uniref:uncharacterized protein LOC122499218 isoform X4 n=1 Tax=Leptopilina heterotoma TaxID=63436 RepID=UPI001CA9D94F|nr:uncharacterized protein LOC122499218 isoform X4 [Leptopilina heterotoma]